MERAAVVLTTPVVSMWISDQMGMRLIYAQHSKCNRDSMLVCVKLNLDVGARLSPSSFKCQGGNHDHHE